VAVLVDLPGPKIRAGAVVGDAIDLVPGRPFRIGPSEPGTAAGVTANHPLAADLEVGDRVLLADGAAELRVTDATGDTVVTVVERGGRIRSAAGIAVPADRLSVPALTPADRARLPGLVALGVDFVGLSFVRRATDVGALADELTRLAAAGRRPAIVAKIETRAAVERADEIVEAADAIMVARGDLGVELPFEEVPLIQKRLIGVALAAGRPVIVATQMLESMVSAPRPTRAEASDVANAALDGADAVMLSAETAIGAHPVEAVDAMARILGAIDRDQSSDGSVVRRGTRVRNRATVPDGAAVAVAAVDLAARSPDVVLLVCWTTTGRTARLLAASRPRVPILAFCPDEAVRRSLALVHGVAASPIEPLGPDRVPDVAAGLMAALSDADVVPAGAAVVLVATVDAGGRGRNLVEICRT
jgi:pyruvate kinase